MRGKGCSPEDELTPRRVREPAEETRSQGGKLPRELSVRRAFRGHEAPVAHPYAVRSSQPPQLIACCLEPRDQLRHVDVSVDRAARHGYVPGEEAPRARVRVPARRELARQRSEPDDVPAVSGEMRGDEPGAWNDVVAEQDADPAGRACHTVDHLERPRLDALRVERAYGVLAGPCNHDARLRRCVVHQISGERGRRRCIDAAAAATSAGYVKRPR